MRSAASFTIYSQPALHPAPTPAPCRHPLHPAGDCRTSTQAQLMQQLGVGLVIIDRCHNHVLPGSEVRRHYMHHDYASEKRDAWRGPSSFLTSIIEDTALNLMNTLPQIVKPPQCSDQQLKKN